MSWIIYPCSQEPSHIEYAQLVIKTAGTPPRQVVIVAQHSPAYVHSLGYVIRHDVEPEKRPANVKWAYVIVEPTHTAANIVG